MQIEDIVFRSKTVELLNSPVSPMAIEINNPEVKIINQNGNSVFLLKDFDLKILDTKNNLPIANLKLIFQVQVALNENEIFSNSDFTQIILPGLFLQINNMLGELFLPRMEYKQFLNILKINS